MIDQYRCDNCALTGGLSEIARCEGCGGNAFDVFMSPALPTDEMIKAGMKAFGDTGLVGERFTERALVAAYSAMIAVA